MKKSVLFFLTLCAVMSACGGSTDEQEMETVSVIETTSPNLTVTLSADQSSTQETDFTPTTIFAPGSVPVQILLEGIGMETPGPWLMFPSYEGFWLVSKEGDRVRLMQTSINDYLERWEMAPQGGLVARVWHDYNDRSLKFLEVISIQSYEHPLILNLLDYDGEGLNFASERDEEEFMVDRYYAVGELSWSSDGSKMAFVSSHQGPSPDVYVYDVLSREVTRLTDGPSHSVNLHWSPDDHYIFHAGVEKMWKEYSGSGYTGWTFYAAKADDSGVTAVFSSDVYQGHVYSIGWFSDHEVLMESGYWFCGSFDLKLVDINNGKQISIWPNQYYHSAYDPVEKVALIWVSPDAFISEECGTVGESGLYLVSIPDGHQEKVMDFEDLNSISSIEWNEEASKFVIDLRNLWAVVDNKGEVEYLEEEPIFSTDGKIKALLGNNGESLQVVDQEGNIFEVSTGNTILSPIWSPDGSRLFFFEESVTGESSLFMVKAPGYERVLIIEDFPANSYDPRWVLP